MTKKYALLSIIVFISTLLYSQTGDLRGSVLDKQSGEPIIFTNVIIKELNTGKITDINGQFVITRIKPGRYVVFAASLEYDTAKAVIEIIADKITTLNLYPLKRKIELKGVTIKGKGHFQKENVNISTTVITQKDLNKLPSFGGEPDLVQYLQILPGVTFSGDQGGQLYIRGGPPVMNKVLLDGMIVYNPFHSIGLFSVFDADLIKNTEVYAGGFNAQYGGRISGVIDVATKDGNKKAFSGKVSINPITTKILFEGPITPFSEDNASASYAISYKTSYLDKTSKMFYSYADPVNGLPYSFNDLYAKYTYVGSNGSRLNLFGFNFNDNAGFNSVKYNWTSNGIGGSALIRPDESSTEINANMGYSNYQMSQTESDGLPRESGIEAFNASVGFTYFIGRDDIKYGFDIVGFGTDYNYLTSSGRRLIDRQFTTEIGGFVKYKKIIGRFVIESGLRAVNYSSLNETSYEPRLGAKYNLNSFIRLKAAGGFYSQNLMSAVSDQDVVNLFYGFLPSPGKDQMPEKIGNNNVVYQRQTAEHGVLGMEIDITRFLSLNAEGFIKNFSQITNINRDKMYDDNVKDRAYLKTKGFSNAEIDRLVSSFVAETGKAYGGDISLKYERKGIYVWVVYSLTNVSRFDGIRTYFPHFDRRHNMNIVFNYTWGKDKSWSASTRWNFASGFPFTQTQGFYEQLNFKNGVTTNTLQQNGQLGIYFGDNLNTGRLPYFHRLDLSLSKKITLNEKSTLNISAAATNVYNRENVFYFDRVNYKRINQLPIMPTLGISLSF